jgi:hypothetical protein
VLPLVMVAGTMLKGLGCSQGNDIIGSRRLRGDFNGFLAPRKVA